MLTDPLVLWLAAGVILFLAEIVVPGVGLMFAGMGALTVGMVINFSLVTPEDTILQTVIFLFATALWTLVLWKPIQKLKFSRNKGSYHNIIGETATVSPKGLNKQDGGEVIWSGALMRARLAGNSGAENMEPGAQVEIKDIVGNTLVVIPKP